MSNSFHFFSKGFREVMRIDSSGNLGIGTASGFKQNGISEISELIEIAEFAKDNPAVAQALERLKTTYYLSKDNGNKEKA